MENEINQISKAKNDILIFMQKKYPAIKFKINVDKPIHGDYLVDLIVFDTPHSNYIYEEVVGTGIVDINHFYVSSEESPAMINMINQRCKAKGYIKHKLITGWNGQPMEESYYLRIDYNEARGEIYQEMYSPKQLEQFNLVDNDPNYIYHVCDYKGNLWQTVAFNTEEALDNIELGEDGLTFQI